MRKKQRQRKCLLGTWQKTQQNPRPLHASPTESPHIHSDYVALLLLEPLSWPASSLVTGLHLASPRGSSSPSQPSLPSSLPPCTGHHTQSPTTAIMMWSVWRKEPSALRRLTCLCLRLRACVVKQSKPHGDPNNEQSYLFPRQTRLAWLSRLDCCPLDVHCTCARALPTIFILYVHRNWPTQEQEQERQTTRMQRTEGKARGVTGGSVVVVVALAVLALVRQGAAAGRAFPCSCFVVLGGAGRPQWALSSPLAPGASCAARAWGREAWLASSPLICKMALTAKEVRKQYMAREKGERGKGPWAIVAARWDSRWSNETRD